MNRRLFLRGAGAALALPLLPSALPRRAWGETPTEPVRLVFVFVPNGLQPEAIVPAAAGPLRDLPPIAAPLAGLEDQVTLFSGMANPAAMLPIPGDHARGTAAFLTCTTVRHTAGSDIRNGVSIDQVVAAHIGAETPLPSLQLGAAPPGTTGDCTAGYSCAYTRNISWAGPATPLPQISDPALLFERLFGRGDLAPEVAAQRALGRASALDAVAAQAGSLSSTLSARDRAKLDEYLTAVRELEQRVQGMGLGSCAPPDALPETTSYPDRLEALLDAVSLALSCDLTRVVTLMFGEGGSNQTFEFVGVPEAHHQVSHHQGDPANLAALTRIGAWEVERYAGLLDRLALTGATDGGSVLDHSLVMLGSEIADGDAHNHDELTVVLGGGGGGSHTPGRHRPMAGRPVADLYLSLAAAAGVPLQRFGDDGRTPLPLDGASG